MRSILVCEKKEKITQVYEESLLLDLRERAGLDPVIYSKEDILASPESYSDVDYLFSTWGMPVFSEEEIGVCLPNLKAVFYAAGTVQRFARPFLKRGIEVYSAWAANAVPVAEYTVAQILLANKGFYAQTRLMAQKRLKDANARKKLCIGNYGEKIGLVGCGMIGSLVAKMLGSYHLEVLVFDSFLSPERAWELGVTSVSLEELFASCRVVSNHLANNEATKGMLTYRHFSSMPQQATFLNTGRGAQVVEADLVRALEEREDLTAVLDVTDPEPCPIDHPFYSLSNCFLTPHIAGSLGDETHRMAEYMKAEWEAVVSGNPTHYSVSEKMLETMA